MTATHPNCSTRSRPAAGRAVVALATILTVIAVGLGSLLAAPASASAFTGAGNAVALQTVPAGQRVGVHEEKLPGQSRERAPAYDRSVVGHCVGAETATSAADSEVGNLQAALCGGESFTATTEILLADGTSVRIDQVRVGDKVLATDPQTGKTQAEPVTALWVNHDTDLLDLTVHTRDGDVVVHTTQHHLFYDLTTKTWVEAQSLHAGDQLYTTDGQLATVVGYQVIPGAADMWDLTVANDHDFYVDTLTTAVLVHNCALPTGKWMSPQDFANSVARDTRNAFRDAATEGGQHGAGLRAAASALRQIVGSSGYLPEINDQLTAIADRWLMRARGIDHPGG